MRKLGRLLCIALVAVTATAVLAVDQASAAAADDEASLLARLNELRASRGLAPLTPAGPLSDVASAWSASMAAAGALSHNPGLSGQVSGWRKLSENVGTGTDAAQVFDALAGSAFHLANMVDPAFDSVGIGVADSPSGPMVTMVFTASGGAAVTAAPAAPQASARTRRVCSRNRRGRLSCRTVRVRR